MAHLAWLPGERHDIASCMQAFDVFVLPSKNEGISNTILEALASGLPVIATAVGGNVELVEDGVTGACRGRQCRTILAQVLRGYLDGPEAPARIAEHGGNARLYAEQRFSIPAMAAAYAAVYDQTLGHRR